MRRLWRRTPTPRPESRTPAPRPELGLRSRRGPDGRVIALSGALHVRTCAPLVEALEDALADDAERIVLDLTALDSIDHPGLDAILTAHLRASDELKVLLIVPGPPRVQWVFDGIQGPFLYAARHGRRAAGHDRPRGRRTSHGGARPDGARRSR
jgi:anti-anti-sigma regulatory factor